MGGLVVKKALILARQSAELLPLVRRFQTILFLATPHRELEQADTLFKIFRTSSGNKPWMSDLLPSSQSILKTINDEFSRYCQHLKIYSFYETLPTSLGPTSTIVVGKDQAVLGYANESSTFLNADHRGMCEFEAISDPNYQAVRNALASAVADLHDHDVRWRQEVKGQQKRLDEILGVTTAVKDDFVEIDGLRTPGTCQWLIEKPSFREWQNRPDGTQIYWMSARPATGKTILSGKVVAHLKSAGLDCSFYFFKNANKSNPSSTISSFLLSMAWQMSQANTGVLSNVLSICKEFNQVSKAHYQTLWRRLFLDGILRTRSQTPRYWIIDALDEWMLRDKLLRMLLEIPEEANLRIFVTSREKIDLEGLPLSPCLNVKSEEILMEDTRSDIKLYLDANFDQLSVSDWRFSKNGWL
jgi:hypothetical protein